TRLVDQASPRRLVGQQHVVGAVELDEARIRDQTRQTTALFDMRRLVLVGVHDQRRALDAARGLLHVGAKRRLEEQRRVLGRYRATLQLHPRALVLDAALQL